jgi:hypothetical protein
MVIGLLLDAFLVRQFLVPALLVLLGARGWRPGRRHGVPSRMWYLPGSGSHSSSVSSPAGASESFHSWAWWGPVSESSWHRLSNDGADMGC